jgi:GNAT superfamily N-acetyltransferase
LGYSARMLGSGSKVCVRKGKVADAPAIAEVFRDSWLLAYRGIIPHAPLEGYIRRRTPEWWRSAVRSGDGVLVLELDSKVVGYATFGGARGRGPYQGEIYELYLDPVHQGLGFGERLFESCRHALDLRKLRGLIVWALIENTPACHFYWRRGGRPIGTAYTKIGTAKLEQVAFTWR